MAQKFEIETRAGDEGSASSRIARVYAEALLDMAEKEGQVEVVESELNTIVGGVFSQFPEVERHVASPIIKRTAKSPILEKAFQGKVSDLTYRFLMVLNTKDRLGLIRHIEAAYRELLDTQAKRTRVLVRTVVPLTPAQEEHLRQTIGHYTGLEPVITVKIDESLLGGMIVQVGDEVFDSSVRTRIESIRNQLLARSSYEIQTGRDRFSHS
jgi:F-type H+-transporting ATPase subunit delta